MSTTELTEATETELLKSIEISVHSVFSVVRRRKLTHDQTVKVVAGGSSADI
jgi:hypothetical protein